MQAIDSIEIEGKLSALSISGSVDLFESWLGNRSIASIGTNAGAPEIPFQGWRHFKEAFPPELIARAVRESDIRVATCLDPFGGSGTSALACQFLGIRPTTIEVNPYLSDLIEAKLSTYHLPALRGAFNRLIARVDDMEVTAALNEFKRNAPATFVEPGLDSKFIYKRAILKRLFQFRFAIDLVRDEQLRRLFRVLLASVAIPVSNVTVSGKGRRYRGGWRDRVIKVQDVDRLFSELVHGAEADLKRFGTRPVRDYSILRGDARALTTKSEPVDLAVFSPPYPNSADYTDVYNVELWTLGYLHSKDSNAELRARTLSSHVQLQRSYEAPPKGSKLLSSVLAKLHHQRNELWHRDIPAMIGAYFADMRTVLHAIYDRLSVRGKVFMVVGESRYAGVKIPTAPILSALATELGFEVLSQEPFRSMRVAPQQGGKPGLAETLIILQKSRT
ncbi:DNA methyltransferase [Bradyrhizobium sp. 141]|uniref:DNA methyltransferase n=1 Tax=Bradyrhizobium sp. 141 TaxID=2782617 RepID=UPI001FFA3BCC|nr:DNA methyltransferase [Bradyrhizobium sp. 141]MCK1717789.1 hypothetical protein [Bradyrhizobium sp. 141]